MEAAREAIERVEPGYLTSRDQLTFVRGEGMMDGEGREGVRERAAESWGGATGRLRGGYSGSAAAARPAVRAPLVRTRPHLLKRQRRTTAPCRMGLLEDAMDGDISAVLESMAIGVAALVGSSTAWSLVQREKGKEEEEVRAAAAAEVGLGADDAAALRLPDQQLQPQPPRSVAVDVDLGENGEPKGVTRINFKPLLPRSEFLLIEPTPPLGLLIEEGKREHTHALSHRCAVH